MAISYLPLDGFIDCCFFFLLNIFSTSFYYRILKACQADMAHTLHYLLPRDDYGYWHVFFPPHHWISQRDPGSCDTVKGRSGGASSWPFNGCKLCGCASVRQLIPLCVMSLMGVTVTECQSHFGQTTPLSAGSLASRGIQHIHHTQREMKGETRNLSPSLSQKNLN